MSARAVFLDRDGTLIEDVGYISDPEDVRLLPGAADALRALREGGYLLVVISNQSGIGRGWIAPEQAEAVHSRFLDALAAAGASVDDTRYCPHAPNDGCDCRKPKPGMIIAAARDHAIDLASSAFVGNSAVDASAGEAAGVRTIVLGTDVDDWDAAVREILQSSNGGA